jgi:hypothetical protein
VQSFHHQKWHLSLNRNTVPIHIYNPQTNKNEAEEEKKFHLSDTMSKVSATCLCTDELKNSGTPTGRDSAKHSGRQSVHSAPCTATSDLIQLAFKALCIDSDATVGYAGPTHEDCMCLNVLNTKRSFQSYKTYWPLPEALNVARCSRASARFT